ncbi:DedA family protein [Crocinitomicaceae bacterium]|nr:DedA family protein [Crocinitomicaceae bacterium]
MDFISLGFLGLFILTFLSATILPLSSEFFLILMFSNGYDPIFCLIIATIGNSLGGFTNYGLGRLGNIYWLKKIGMSEAKIQKYATRIQKYGAWLAFFSWVPFIGDPLLVALGFFRSPFLKVAILTVLGKFLRYLTIYLLYQ